MQRRRISRVCPAPFSSDPPSHLGGLFVFNDEYSRMSLGGAYDGRLASHFYNTHNLIHFNMSCYVTPFRQTVSGVTFDRSRVRLD